MIDQLYFSNKTGNEMIMNSSIVVSPNITMTYPSSSSSIIFSILIGIGLGLIALITAFGNMIVLLAFYCDKKLRTVNDYFILNMAIADFLVGFFCIPFYIPSSLTQLWPFGSFFCKIWVTVDDVATMASVINIVAISINRYWSIAYPISYRKYVKQDFVYLVMGGVWCLSFINFAPGIWLLGLFNNETNVTRSDCLGDYNNSFVYMLIAQFNYFIWPFIVLCVLNMLIMLNIWKRSRKMSQLMSLNQCVKGKEENVGSSTLGTSKDTEDDQRLSILPKHKINSIERCPSIIVEENDNILQSNKHLHHVFNKNKKKSSNKCQHTIKMNHTKSSNLRSPSRSQFLIDKDFEETRQSSKTVLSTRKSISVNFSTLRNYRSGSFTEYQTEREFDISRTNLSEIGSSNRSQRQCQEYRQKRSRIVRDRKAARSLFILVIVFLIFLFPYVICAIAITAGAKISLIISEISFWLLWMNSTCNPFLYPFIQIKYRRAYVKLFQSCTKYLPFSRSNQLF